MSKHLGLGGIVHWQQDSRHQSCSLSSGQSSPPKTSNALVPQDDFVHREKRPGDIGALVHISTLHPHLDHICWCCQSCGHTSSNNSRIIARTAVRMIIVPTMLVQMIGSPNIVT